MRVDPLEDRIVPNGLIPSLFSLCQMVKVTEARLQLDRPHLEHQIHQNIHRLIIKDERKIHVC